MRHPSPVLVVDDQPEVRSVVSLILRAEGYQVETAANGAEALEALDQVEPACVLLDMRMPVLDGWGFARELEARQIDVPVVVMTAARDARSWCDEIKAADCLPKPFDLYDLLGCVERACAQAGPTVH
jgi:CheY-like chemotaxis protein